MALREKIELLDQLKDRYDSDLSEPELERLRAEFDTLELSKIGFIQDKEHDRGRLFVCPDPEWEFPDVYEVAEEFMPKAIEVIYDAIALYYRESYFWDEVTGLISDDLVRIYTNLNNIPIIRYFPAKEVELLNVRKLNSDIR